MNKPLLTAVVVAVLAGGPAAAQLQAQGPGMRPPVNTASPMVAVVDIEQIYKKLDGFKVQMENMQREVKAAEDKLNAERLAINKMIEKAKDSQLNPKGPDFRRLEADIAQKQADYQIRMKLQNRDLMERQAALFYKTYQEISEVIREYSEKRGIALVLRFDSMQVDPTDRESVFREINKPVQYQQSIDITQIIIDELNRRANVAGAPGAPGAPRGTGGYQGAPNGPPGGRSFGPPGPNGGQPGGGLR